MHQQARQRKLNLAQLYIKRYWDLEDLRLAQEVPDHVLALRYDRLCEDEYEVARLGWIDTNVWAVWHRSIQSYLNEAERNVAEFDLLSQCQRGPVQHHGNECPALMKQPAARKLSSRLERWWSTHIF